MNASTAYLCGPDRGLIPDGHGYVALLHHFTTACHLNIEIGDFFSQGIAVNT